MFNSKRFLVLTLVTVFSCSRCTWSASLTSNVDAINWASRPTANHTERQGRQHSISNSNFNSNNDNNNNYIHKNDNTNLNGEGASHSSYSITPSFSYQFHTNDHEHLDGIVLAHQNSPSVNDVNGAVGNGGGISRSDVVSSKISIAENVPSSDATILEAASIQRRDDAVTDLPRTGSNSYPGFDFSQYQNQNQVWYNAQQRRDWESKQQQQQHFSGPKAVLQEKYLPHGVQVGELRDDNNGTRISNPYSYPSFSRQSTTIKSEEIRNNSTQFVYSRPPKNHQTPNGTPITYQGQQPQQVHTAGSYSSYKDSAVQRADVSTMRSMPAEVKPTFAFSQRRRPGAKRKILQSRADDTYAGEGADEGVAAAAQDEEDEEHLHYYDHDHGNDHNYEQGQGETYDHDEHDQGDNENEYYYGNNGGNVQAGHHEDPALRDFGQGNAGGFGGPPPLTGPGGPPGLPPIPPPGIGGPLPPPPGPLKGSIDYILIPLILIGLAGPIFVVLYVVLGGFEYKLAPISRSLKGSFADYQPYLDNITSSVGRALETYECPNYAACRLKGFCSELGLKSSTANSIETVLSSVTPKDYLSTLNSVFSFLKNPAEEDCSRYKCSSMIDYLPTKF